MGRARALATLIGNLEMDEPVGVGAWVDDLRAAVAMFEDFTGNTRVLRFIGRRDARGVKKG